MAAVCGAGAVLHSHSQAGTLLSQWSLPRGHLRLQDLEMLKGLDGMNTHQTSVSLPVLAWWGLFLVVVPYTTPVEEKES